jgi:hypothetical protein
VYAAGSEVTPRRVTAPLISCLLTDVYSSPKTTVLPLQQKLCLCTLLLMMKRDGRGKGVLLGKVRVKGQGRDIMSLTAYCQGGRHAVFLRVLSFKCNTY